MKVLIACEYSGRVRDAFLARGHEAISCDLLPTEVPGPHYQGDVTELLHMDAFVRHNDCVLTLQDAIMFKEIDGFPAYRVSEEGEIETCWQWGAFYAGMVAEKKWRQLPVKPNSKGYMPVNLRDVGGKGRRTHIHRLVAEVHVSPPPFENACVRHLDGNPLNNKAENLAWGTYLDNENDKLAHGTHRSRITNAKLTPGKMATAKKMRTEGATINAIAKTVGVSRPTISRLLSGATWRKP